MLKWNSGLVCFPACTEVSLEMIWMPYIAGIETAGYGLMTRSLISSNCRHSGHILLELTLARLYRLYLLKTEWIHFLWRRVTTLLSLLVFCVRSGAPQVRMKKWNLQKSDECHLQSSARFRNLYFLSECDYLFVKLHNTISRNTRTFIKCLWWRKTIGIYLGIIVPRWRR